MTVSVTLLGIIGPGFVTSTPTLSAGQSAANAGPAKPRVAATNAAAERNLFFVMSVSFCGCRRVRDIGCENRGDRDRTEMPATSRNHSRRLSAFSLRLWRFPLGIERTKLETGFEPQAVRAVCCRSKQTD